MTDGKKAVVTGGAGFIGSRLTKVLREKGFEVAVVDRKEGKDIRDREVLTEAMRGASFVFHLAALPRVEYSIEHPDETNNTNLDGTLSVLLAAKDAGAARLIYSSSSAIYGDAVQVPVAEVAPARPKSPYALQKYAGELYCRLWSEVYGMPTVSLRYFNAYGPGADPEGPYALLIARFLKLRAEGKPLTITGDGTQTRDFVHVDDVVRANLLAAESEKVGKGESINIGSGRNYSVNDIAKLIGGPVEHVAPRLEPHDTLADITLARELLGWEPAVSLEAGLAALKKETGLA